jgi:hypothetical protein
MPMPGVLGNCHLTGRELEMQLLSDLDFGSLSDNDLQYLIRELTQRERAISCERRLLHKYLDLLGVERPVQVTGVPLDGWVGKLAARENDVSYERSLLQARLDIMRAMRKERRAGRSSVSLGRDNLIKALSRHGGRPAVLTRDACLSTP